MAVAVFALTAGPAGGQAIVSTLPNTTDGIHVGVPFVRCFRELWAASGGTRSGCAASDEQNSVSSLNGKVDIGFMWSYGRYSPAQLGVNVNLGASLKIDRFPGYVSANPVWPAAPVTLSDWQQSHPTWIEYTCAVDAQGRHTTPAWEFGQVPASPAAEAYVPFNVNDPQARQFFFDTYVKPSLENGYRIIFFDNLHMRRNSWDRCGHYDDQGQWVQDYPGAKSPYDPRWQADMLSWLQYLRDAIHAYAPGARLGMNYNPVEDGDSPALYQQVFKIVDVVWEEGGFTYWGVQRLSTDYMWNQQFAAMKWLAAQPDKGLFINGVSGGHTSRTASQISFDDRQWVIGNYLLTKGAHTYTVITPDAYGSFTDFPEYNIPIGSPQGDASESEGVWIRRFTGGWSIVNPDTITHTITVPTGFTDAQGHSVQGDVALSPTSALILLSPRSAHGGGGGSGSIVVKRSTVVKVGSIALSHASLTGIAKRRPKLAFTLTVVRPHAKPIQTIAVRLKRGLGFARTTRRLAHGITVVDSRGRHLKFTAGLSYSALKLTLNAPILKLRITVAGSAISATRVFALSAQRKHANPFHFRVRATDTRSVMRLLPLALKPTS